MVGEWIDYISPKTGEDMILEILFEIDGEYICRIVDYTKPTYKLKYGGYIAIPKGAANV